MDNKEICTVCGKSPREKDRRYCHRCYLDRRKVFSRKREGERLRYGIGNCISCGGRIILGHANQRYCRECYISISKIGTNSTNNYDNAGGGGYCWLHRKIVEEILKRKLSTNEVVHHIDCNPKNNVISNLIVISRVQHGRLHQFLRETRAAFEKSKDVKNENCWDTLIASLTTTWLETASVKVIKIMEIGQSAAKAPAYGEGSETMRVPSKVLFDSTMKMI